MPYHPKDHRTQLKLAYLGYAVGPLDGVWGPKTTAAIKQFQQNNGLRVTGNCNSDNGDTYATLDSAFMNNNYLMNGAVLQWLLYWAGYNPGKIDGIIGRNTRNALMNFQNSVGLSMTGDQDSDTIWYLKNSIMPAG